MALFYKSLSDSALTVKDKKPANQGTPHNTISCYLHVHLSPVFLNVVHYRLLKRRFLIQETERKQRKKEKEDDISSG